ncbi:MAG: hypothetical protein ACMXYD_01535 [Candidatus Woesearchaeota archaeon]
MKSKLRVQAEHLATKLTSAINHQRVSAVVYEEETITIHVLVKEAALGLGRTVLSVDFDEKNKQVVVVHLCEKTIIDDSLTQTKTALEAFSSKNQFLVVYE